MSDFIHYYAEYHILFIIILTVVILNVVMPIVVMQDKCLKRVDRVNYYSLFGLRVLRVKGSGRKYD